MKIKIAIIEDEPASARNLQYQLKELEPGIEVLAVLDSVVSAIEWLQINHLLCDLLFMDIRLTDGMSFEIFDNVPLEAPVIFITAYNEYALQAFKANGIDYVLKPFDEEALDLTLKKFKKLTGTAQIVNTTYLNSILQKIQSQVSFRRSFLVHYRDKLLPLNVMDIQWFYTENEIVQAAVTDGKLYIIDGTLEKLQQELDPSLFFRANRQFLINRKAIQEVNFYFNGRLSLKVFPLPKSSILISKARVPEFRLWMNA